jgi:predicted RNase H-like HicB family nuclease
MTNYIALIRKEKNSDYGVDFPDFPGCISAGSTMDEAKDMANEALQGHIKLMVEENIELPESSSLDQIMSDKENQEAVAFLVPILEKIKTVRINVTVPENILTVIDNKAKDKGETRSGFLVRAALNY